MGKAQGVSWVATQRLSAVFDYGRNHHDQVLHCCFTSRRHAPSPPSFQLTLCQPAVLFHPAAAAHEAIVSSPAGNTKAITSKRRGGHGCSRVRSNAKHVLLLPPPEPCSVNSSCVKAFSYESTMHVLLQSESDFTMQAAYCFQLVELFTPMMHAKQEWHHLIFSYILMQEFRL